MYKFILNKAVKPVILSLVFNKLNYLINKLSTLPKFIILAESFKNLFEIAFHQNSFFYFLTLT
ncbi:hypothetical protein HMPREF0216_02925, partial [Clostridium celatum DSM 1785]